MTSINYPQAHSASTPNHPGPNRRRRRQRKSSSNFSHTFSQLLSQTPKIVKIAAAAAVAIGTVGACVYYKYRKEVALPPPEVVAPPPEEVPSKFDTILSTCKNFLLENSTWKSAVFVGGPVLALVGTGYCIHHAGVANQNPRIDGPGRKPENHLPANKNPNKENTKREILPRQATQVQNLGISIVEDSAVQTGPLYIESSDSHIPKPIKQENDQIVKSPKEEPIEKLKRYHQCLANEDVEFWNKAELEKILGNVQNCSENEINNMLVRLEPIHTFVQSVNRHIEELRSAPYKQCSKIFLLLAAKRNVIYFQNSNIRKDDYANFVLNQRDIPLSEQMRLIANELIRSPKQLKDSLQELAKDELIDSLKKQIVAFSNLLSSYPISKDVQRAITQLFQTRVDSIKSYEDDVPIILKVVNTFNSKHSLCSIMQLIVDYLVGKGVLTSKPEDLFNEYKQGIADALTSLSSSVDWDTFSASLTKSLDSLNNTENKIAQLKNLDKSAFSEKMKVRYDALSKILSYYFQHFWSFDDLKHQILWIVSNLTDEKATDERILAEIKNVKNIDSNVEFYLSYVLHLQQVKDTTSEASKLLNEQKNIYPQLKTFNEWMEYHKNLKGKYSQLRDKLSKLGDQDSRYTERDTVLASSKKIDTEKFATFSGVNFYIGQREKDICAAYAGGTIVLDREFNAIGFSRDPENEQILLNNRKALVNKATKYLDKLEKNCSAFKNSQGSPDLVKKMKERLNPVFESVKERLESINNIVRDKDIFSTEDVLEDLNRLITDLTDLKVQLDDFKNINSYLSAIIDATTRQYIKIEKVRLLICKNKSIEDCKKDLKIIAEEKDQTLLNQVKSVGSTLFEDHGSNLPVIYNSLKELIIKDLSRLKDQSKVVSTDIENKFRSLEDFVFDSTDEDRLKALGLKFAKAVEDFQNSLNV